MINFDNSIQYYIDDNGNAVRLMYQETPPTDRQILVSASCANAVSLMSDEVFEKLMIGEYSLCNHEVSKRQVRCHISGYFSLKEMMMEKGIKGRLLATKNIRMSSIPRVFFKKATMIPDSFKSFLSAKIAEIIIVEQKIDEIRVKPKSMRSNRTNEVLANQIAYKDNLYEKLKEL